MLPLLQDNYDYCHSLLLSILTCLGNTPLEVKLQGFRKLIIQHFISNYDDIVLIYVSMARLMEHKAISFLMELWDVVSIFSHTSWRAWPSRVGHLSSGPLPNSDRLHP